MKSSPKVLRWLVRIVFLLLSFALLIGGPLPVWMMKLLKPSGGFIEEVAILPAWAAKIVPSVSPLSFLAAVTAHRADRLMILWVLPAAVLAIAAVFKGRFFCRWICPMGTVYAVSCVKNTGKYFLRRKLSGHLFWGIIFSSLIGFPVLLFLDPLSTFSRVNLIFEGSLTFAAVIPGIIFPAFLIAGIIQPMIWCSHFCPLGYMFDFMRRSDVKYTEKFKRGRREMAAGLLFSLPLALLMKKNPFVEDKNYPVLPPGAGDKDTFSSLCTRCYACVNVCPTRILRVGFPDGADVGRWFQPEMNAYEGTCQESCNNCTQVCPTGAIKNLSFAEKHSTQIGVAEVIKSKCIAWSLGEYCVVCDEFCPYGAIDDDPLENGLSRPVVNSEKCRGCGICQNACPVRENGAAIVVRGVREQRRISLINS